MIYIFTRPLCHACQVLKQTLLTKGEDFVEVDGKVLTGEEGYSNVDVPVDVLIQVQTKRMLEGQSWPPPVPVLVKDDVAFGLENALELIHDSTAMCQTSQ